MTPATITFGPAGLRAIVDRLRADGRTVIGPTVRDGAVVLAELASADELPYGAGDRQDPGRYQLVAEAHHRWFGHAAPAQPWKRYLLPERTLLVSARRSEDDVELLEVPASSEHLAFVGMRSCDVHALAILDRVLGTGRYADPGYLTRRADLLVVAVDCETPSSTCFCASAGTGPGVDVRGVADVVLAEVGAGSDHRFVASVESQRGAELVAGIDSSPADEHDRHARAAQAEAAAAAQTRVIDLDSVRRAGAVPEHPQWAHVAERCLSCTNCTMVCPTCFCTTIEDTTSLDGTEAQRWRRWDSCFTLGFTYVHGGAVRPSPRARYRQWLLHKLDTWHDQFGSAGCVGCGRCITWCPAGIDITDEARALASTAAGGEGGPS